MFRRPTLEWKATDPSVLEARDGQYKYVVYSDANHAQLRLIRYDFIEGGLGVPFYDFSLTVRDLPMAMKTAEKINRIFRKARRYNGLVTL
jgi:hypothetical protein